MTKLSLFKFVHRQNASQNAGENLLLFNYRALQEISRFALSLVTPHNILKKISNQQYFISSQKGKIILSINAEIIS